MNLNLTKLGLEDDETIKWSHVHSLQHIECLSEHREQLITSNIILTDTTLAFKGKIYSIETGNELLQSEEDESSHLLHKDVVSLTTNIVLFHNKNYANKEFELVLKSNPESRELSIFDSNLW